MSFGQYFTFAEATAEDSLTGTTTLTTTLTLTTPSVEAGDYLIEFSFTWRADSTSYDIDAQILQDSTDTLWQMREEPEDLSSDQRIPAGGFAQVTLTAGVHTFELQFAPTNASITAYVYNRRAVMWRTD